MRKYLKQTTFEAPEHWASYYVNGDSSGLDPVERERADAYARAECGDVCNIVSCADNSRFTWHYSLFGGNAQGGTVTTYHAII